VNLQFPHLLNPTSDMPLDLASSDSLTFGEHHKDLAVYAKCQRILLTNRSQPFDSHAASVLAWIVAVGLQAKLPLNPIYDSAAKTRLLMQENIKLRTAFEAVWKDPAAHVSSVLDRRMCSSSPSQRISF
jgi:hypothetical protein